MTREWQFAVASTVVLLSFAACGGEDPPPRDPQSIQTPLPTEDPRPVSRDAVRVDRAAPAPTHASTAPATPPTVAPPADTAARPAPAENAYTGPCDNCKKGVVTNELQAALTKRAQESRRCYEKALTNDSRARASMTMEIKVGRDGNACELGANVDPPEIPGLTECVRGEFQRGGFPTPGGPGGIGCVVARVPILFQPAGTSVQGR